MWKHFSRFGTAIDIFILSKRSKQGKLFGFVKYKDVSSVEALLNKIQSVAIGANWLTIHEEKYRREMGEVRQRPTTWRQRTQITTFAQNNQASPTLSGKNLLLDTQAWSEGVRLEQKTKELVCSVRKEEIERLKSCAIGEAKSYTQIDRLSKLLKDANFFHCSMRYLGDLRVLTECASPHDLNKLIASVNLTLADWFTKLSPWTLEKEQVRPERIVWLNISGVPLHVWHGETFHRIASLWGTVIEIEDLTTRRSQTHIGRACVLTDHIENAGSTINLRVKKVMYKVCVIKDVAEATIYGQRYAYHRYHPETDSNSV